ncbi:MAG: bifunctional methylenetetrahydrofolate dehydrogenase/methenyltetrahydrofolate cyclohydrolase FolD [Pseudomonadota bacterium]|nr:bifunctional methylenetetrahydrofolate dehydrogenase/methenyltetrahydrofolate cyclohydrolase FolD [Pseudomonadota bacterium]
MTETRIIDGKAMARDLRTRIAAGVATLKARTGVVPGLAFILAGDDPASQVYVRRKDRACRAAGMESLEYRLPADTAQQALLDLIARLNTDPRAHGILVQLPLPAGLDTRTVIQAIDPAKDVDGIHPVNMGRLVQGLPSPTPCTPMGCMMLLRHAMTGLAGKKALVVGRSMIVGRPMSSLLLAADCTVTVAHAKTADLAAEVRQADILVAAAGKPGLIRGEWLKPGVVVIDVGINRIPGADGKTRLVGDVDFEGAQGVAAAITPVPGGVGPMTIACLLLNTLKTASLALGVPCPVEAVF